MKRSFFYILSLVFLLLISCERQTIVQYPESIVGYWASAEGGTYDFASLEILPLESGKSATIVNVISYNKPLVTDLHGLISYDSQTGVATFTSEDEAFVVTAQVVTGDTILLNVNEVHDGMTAILFKGTLTRAIKPKKKREEINYTLMLSNYSRGDDGRYIIAFAGTHGNSTIGAVQIKTTRPLETLEGTFSIANGDFEAKSTFFIADYANVQTEEDIIYPDTMSVTISHKQDSYYNVDIQINDRDVIYRLTSSSGAIPFIDLRWGTEPTETVTIDQTFSSFNGGVLSQGDTTLVDITLLNNRTGLYLSFITQSGLEKGAYPFTLERKYGVATASKGYDVEVGMIYPSCLAILNSEGNAEKLYFFADGEVIVDYTAQDTISITGYATSHYGSRINFSYKGEYAFAALHVSKRLREYVPFYLQRERMPNNLLIAPVHVCE